MNAPMDVISPKERQAKPSLNLMLLASYVAEIEGMIADPEMDGSERERLRKWWDRRRRRVARKLRQQRAAGKGGDARQRFLGLMAEIMLSPSSTRANQLPGLLNALMEYQQEAAEIRDRVERDPGGHTWRFGNHQQNDDFDAVRFIQQQYDVIEAWDDELFQVDLAWRKLAASLQTQDHQRKNIQKLFNLLEGDRKIITDFRDKLLRTRNIVNSVDAILSVAYRTHDPHLWNEIQRQLYAYEDHQRKTPGVPIPNHRSIRWLETAFSTLKQRREELARYMAEIVAAVTFQKEEAGDVICASASVSPPVPQSVDVMGDPQTWARCFIERQRAQGDLFLEKSLLEYAKQQLSQFENKASVHGYGKYTKGVSDILQRDLEAELREQAGFPQNQKLSTYLQDAVDHIAALRKHLVVIAGGRLQREEEPIPAFSRYPIILEDVIGNIKQGKFETAQGRCRGTLFPPEAGEEGNPVHADQEQDWGNALPSPPQTLWQAEKRLQHLMHAAQQRAELGMAQRLQRRMGKEQARLAQEREQVTQLSQRIDVLRRRYEACRDEFGILWNRYWRVRHSWKMKIPFRWIFRNAPSEAERYLRQARAHYCECLMLCPQDLWVTGRHDMVFAGSSPTCQPLSEQEWQRRYLESPDTELFP